MARVTLSSSAAVAPAARPAWRGRHRIALLAVAVIALAVMWATNLLLTERFTETNRNRAALRLALYSGNILSEMKRTSVVPLLLARDPELTTALVTRDFSITSARLLSAQREIGTASIQLLDDQGVVRAATNRRLLGSRLGTSPAFLDAQRSKETVFQAVTGETGAIDFIYSRAVVKDGRTLGVILVGAELAKLETGWRSISEAVAALDSAGRVVLATEPRWRGLMLSDALEVRSAPSAIDRALRFTTDITLPAPDAYLKGVAVMRTEARVPFQGWRLVSFSTYDPIRERVNAVLALEIMAFALVLAVGFWLLSRRFRSESDALQRESVELRALNARLSREVAERVRAQENLAVAEQTLEQSSKLAVLGEMSASVSHELNQPLAAMKTYLAGARLLLERKRSDEALSSFQRIDDLIDRMGAITRQLKSYARKGGEAFEPVDLRAAISSALAMMEPQLKTRAVRITRSMPRAPVMVMADRIRLEQVIINLLRNAVDATKSETEPQVDILLTAGETALLAVRDNGTGLENLDKLFEPFWTTKKPGEGTGLGLAISSGIVSDFGGRLTAHNAPDGGAVFEVYLPLLGAAQGKTEAAE